jgi:hypothetical protein
MSVSMSVSMSWDRPAVRRAGVVLAALLLAGTTLPRRLSAQAASDVRSTVSLELSRSWNARSVQPREPLDATLSSVTAQLAHPLGHWAGLSWHYVLDVTPFMAVRLGASADRLTQIGAGLKNEYSVRTSHGAGVSPLGVRLARRLGANTHAILETTGGGAFFSRIVPYGEDATHNNFTSTSRLLLERRSESGRAWAAGYILYHVSNGGFGRSNPGINANLLVVRVTQQSNRH